MISHINLKELYSFFYTVLVIIVILFFSLQVRLLLATVATVY